MRLITGEVAPLAPLLIPLGEVLLWAVFLGLCLGAVYLARAFFGTANSAVGWIPYVGKILSTSLTNVEHKLVSLLSGAAASADARMGAALHELARVVDWMGEEIRRHANLIEIIAGLLAGTAGVGLVAAAIANLLNHSKVAKATATHALHTVITVQREIRVGIGHDVLPRIKSLEHTVGGVIAHDLPGIRAGERTLWRGIDDLRKWVHRHALIAGTLGFTAAVAWALARLGAGWTRCTNWQRVGREVCGTPIGDLEALLGLLATGAVIADFRQLVELAQSVEHGVAVALQDVAKA